MNDLINGRGDFAFNIWLMALIALWRASRNG